MWPISGIDLLGVMYHRFPVTHGIIEISAPSNI